MAKAQSLNESMMMPPKVRSPFRQGSPLAPSPSSSRIFLDPVREQIRIEDYEAKLVENPSPWMWPDQRSPKTVSPGLIGLQIHESTQREALGMPAEQSDQTSYISPGEKSVGNLHPEPALPAEHRAAGNTQHLLASADPTDLIGLWRGQDRGQEVNCIIGSSDFHSAEPQSDITGNHERRIEAIGYNHRATQVDTSKRVQSMSDEERQTRFDGQTQPNHKSELSWSDSVIAEPSNVHNTHGLNESRARSSLLSTLPSVQTPEAAALAQTVGHSILKPTLTSELRSSTPPQT